MTGGKLTPKDLLRTAIWCVRHPIFAYHLVKAARAALKRK